LSNSTTIEASIRGGEIRIFSLFYEIFRRVAKLHGVINHDALFKSLLKTGRLLRDFFEAFLPEIYSFIDFDHIEFVDKERFTLDGKRRTGDLLIKTRLRGEDAAFLIHLEHEAQARRDLARRMLEYFVLDWREFNLRVYPIAVLSHGEIDPESRNPLQMAIRGRSILDFHFAVVDLARLDARQYVKRLNAAAMALSARMRVEPGCRVSLAVDFVRNTVQANWSRGELDAVSGFFFAYQKFTREEGLKLRRKLGIIQNMKVPRKVKLRNPFVWWGFTEGRHEGEIGLVLQMLTHRLGSVTARQRQAIRRLSSRSVKSLGKALLDFTTGSDLSHWLKSHVK
jgi:hypothetical protein